MHQTLQSKAAFGNRGSCHDALVTQTFIFVLSTRFQVAAGTCDGCFLRPCEAAAANQAVLKEMRLVTAMA